MRVRHPRDGRNTLLQFLGDAQILGPIVADGAHVDLRGDAEVENLRDHVGGLEIEHAFREARRQRLAQLADVVQRRSVVLFQRDQNHAVVEAGRGAVAEGVIIGTGRQADIVDDQVAFVLGDDLADLVLHRLENLLGLLDACAGRGAHVELNLAAIDDRKEVAADEHEHGAAEREHRGRRHRHDEPPRQQRMQYFRVSAAHDFEAMLELGEQAPKPALRRLRPVSFPLEQQADGDRGQGSRKAVGGQHGEHNG